MFDEKHEGYDPHPDFLEIFIGKDKSELTLLESRIFSLNPELDCCLLCGKVQWSDNYECEFCDSDD